MARVRIPRLHPDTMVYRILQFIKESNEPVTITTMIANEIEHRNNHANPFPPFQWNNATITHSLDRILKQLIDNNYIKKDRFGVYTALDFKWHKQNHLQVSKREAMYIMNHLTTSRKYKIKMSTKAHIRLITSLQNLIKSFL